MKSRAAGHLRGEVFSVQEVERLPGSKGRGGGPNRMGGGGPSSGLDQGLWSRSHKDVAWSVKRSCVVGDLSLPC